MTELNLILFSWEVSYKKEETKSAINAAYKVKIILQEARGFHNKRKAFAHKLESLLSHCGCASTKSSPFTFHLCITSRPPIGNIYTIISTIISSISIGFQPDGVLCFLQLHLGKSQINACGAPEVWTLVDQITLY